MIPAIYTYSQQAKKIAMGLIKVSNEGYKTSEALEALLNELKEISKDVKGFEIKKVEDYASLSNELKDDVYTLIFEISHHHPNNHVCSVCFHLIEELSKLDDKGFFNQVETSEEAFLTSSSC